MAESHAHAVWSGDLLGGSGTVAPASGAFGELPVTWKARTERPDPKTSPEELIAAAHAACYAMALSNTLAGAGSPPERLEVSATVHFDLHEGGAAVTRVELDVHGSVPGLDASGFQQLAEQGEAACPVSNALRGNVEIRLAATLDGG
jgi:lipoyl-dependent peroxiredoxin